MLHRLISAAQSNWEQRLLHILFLKIYTHFHNKKIHTYRKFGKMREKIEDDRKGLTLFRLLEIATSISL